jgi:hypothetical protein
MLQRTNDIIYNPTGFKQVGGLVNSVANFNHNFSK